MKKFSLAVHGGAGTIPKELLTEEQSAIHKQGLEDSLEAGHKVLEDGGSAIDAVIASVVTLEDNILFNAGRGAVFSNSGKHEMDACLMDGATLNVGAVTSVENIKNPIKLAHKILTDSPHVLLCREGAQEFAKIHNIETAPSDYFFSQTRFDQWNLALESDQVILDHGGEIKPRTGTVGAVALDQYGNLACATSTGGMTNKKFNRIGDTPIVGAGSYANNNTCALSCTGYGEFFIRAVVAYDISCLMEYKGLSLKEAMDLVLLEKLAKIGGKGGIIGLDMAGNIHMVFNTSVMYRGYINSAGEKFIGIS